MNRGLIRIKRQGAARARRLAMAVTSATDRARMLAYATELDAQADALAAEPASLPRTTREQVPGPQGPSTKRREKK